MVTGTDGDGNDVTFNVLWPAIIEKVWAKVKHGYFQASGGFVATGIRFLTGAPVILYDVQDIYPTKGEVIGQDSDGNDILAPYGYDEIFSMLEDAIAANYVVGVGTDGNGSDSEKNACNIAMSHAYSILGAFTIDHVDGSSERALLIRNPWGTANYNGPLSKDDSLWTNDLVQQVPLNVDPRTDQEAYGMFVVPFTRFVQQDDPSDDCFSDLQIGHLRDDEGYSNDWYDLEDIEDETVHNFVVQPRENDGDLYFTTEGYYYNMLHEDCTTGTYYDYYGNSVGTRIQPLVFFKVQKEGES